VSGWLLVAVVIAVLVLLGSALKTIGRP